MGEGATRPQGDSIHAGEARARDPGRLTVAEPVSASGIRSRTEQLSIEQLGLDEFPLLAEPFHLSLRRTRFVEAMRRLGKLMFDRAIPAPADFESVVRPNSIAVFMVGRMAEREGFEPDPGPPPEQQVTDSESDLVPSDPLKPP